MKDRPAPVSVSQPHWRWVLLLLFVLTTLCGFAFMASAGSALFGAIPLFMVLMMLVSRTEVSFPNDRAGCALVSTNIFSVVVRKRFCGTDPFAIVELSQRRGRAVAYDLVLRDGTGSRIPLASYERAEDAFAMEATLSKAIRRWQSDLDARGLRQELTHVVTQEVPNSTRG
jgi:hypothetical protein